ncbi:MAG: class I mannose-6-phosphate isomerase, partial [Christensenellales bacterium]
MDKKTIVTNPIFFENNRVFRVYLGGKGFEGFLPDATDGCFPEEWVASKVKAINPRYFGKRDGVSVVKGTDVFFDDLLAEFPEELLGGKKYDCLVKFLDSAIRLPVQVHPTKEFSRRHFNSDYGKTEAWLVIATRENPRLYFGFNRPMSKDELSVLEEKSETEKDVMQSVLCSVTPKVGDVYLITAGLIHAIGAGCTIVEIQEPTDFTIQPERWCGDYHISYEEEYIGLSKSDALDCFDYNLYGEKALKLAKKVPVTLKNENGVKTESLIS